MSALSAAGGDDLPASQSFAFFVVTPITGATVHFGSFLPLIAFDRGRHAAAADRPTGRTPQSRSGAP